MKRLLVLVLGVCGTLSAKKIDHYVYFELERARIEEKSFLEAPGIAGAQLKYSWDELEPEKDRYDFRAIDRDLEFLAKRDKRLFLQIQDITFNVAKKFVPKYLTTDPKYHGGVALHYVGEGDDAKPEGWIARRWDKAVSERFHRLLEALGKRFDGKIAGINLPETAFAYGSRDDRMPAGFTPAAYRDAVVETMTVLKRAFPKSVAMQYANFMPGEWLPEDDGGFLRDVYAAGVKLGVAMGGPDLLPYKPGQMKHAYRFLPDAGTKTRTGIAAQWDNYEHVNPKTGKRTSVAEMYAFAHDKLAVDYIFWCTQEPYYTRDVLPFVARPLQR